MVLPEEMNGRPGVRDNPVPGSMMLVSSSQAIKVHLGAFDQGIEGWENTDITPHLWVGRIPGLPRLLQMVGVINGTRFEQHRNGVFRRLRHLDLTRPLPYADNSVAAFYSSHVLEHLFMGEVEALIPELYRCLVPGGVCRVVVPDLEKIVQSYDREDPRRFIAEIFEVSARGSVKNAHHSGFTGPLLCRLFREAGFSQVGVQAYGIGGCPDLERLDCRPESLFFEAVK